MKGGKVSVHEHRIDPDWVAPFGDGHQFYFRGSFNREPLLTDLLEAGYLITLHVGCNGKLELISQGKTNLIRCRTCYHQLTVPRSLKTVGDLITYLRAYLGPYP